MGERVPILGVEHHRGRLAGNNQAPFGYSPRGFSQILWRVHDWGWHTARRTSRGASWLARRCARLHLMHVRLRRVILGMAAAKKPLPIPVKPAPAAQ